MFNPVFNKDGSVSYFRIICLITALGCFICGCVMNSNSNDDELAQVPAKEQSDASLRAQTENARISSLKLREKAVEEFVSNTEFMQTCGTLDRSYDNCVVELSDDLKPYYSLALDSSDDGYSMVIEATPQNNDSCRLFESNSNGEILGLNDKGESDKNCLLDLENKSNTFKVLRDTDNKSGQSAPSGLTPLVKQLTNR